MLTDYHAKYFAYELTRRCPSDSVERIASTLMDSQVDLNPHQPELHRRPVMAALVAALLIASWPPNAQPHGNNPQQPVTDNCRTPCGLPDGCQ